jgi:hypothetical protein
MTKKFANKTEIAEWIESVDEHNVQPGDIEDELAAAWLCVYGRELSTEDADTRRDAWSLLCSDVL